MGDTEKQEFMLIVCMNLCFQERAKLNCNLLINLIPF